MRHWSPIQKLDAILTEMARMEGREPETICPVLFRELRDLVDMALELRRLRKVLGIGNMTAQELEALLSAEDRDTLEVAALLTRALERIEALEERLGLECQDDRAPPVDAPDPALGKRVLDDGAGARAGAHEDGHRVQSSGRRARAGGHRSPAGG